MRQGVSGKLILGLWIVTVVLSLVGVGSFLDESITGIMFAHRIEVKSAINDSTTVLTLSDVHINQALSDEAFTEDALSRK